jgi:hypothetical protein
MPALSKPPRVFITHSSLDRDLAEAIVRALRLGTGLSVDQVFCSSVEGFGVPTGRDFLLYIQRQLASTELVVPLITPAYLDSTFCMWELGATWVRDVETFPILVPPVTVEALEGPLRTMQVSRLDKSGMNGLAAKVGGIIDRIPVPNVWEPERDRVIDQLPTLMPQLQVAWAGTRQAKLRRAARHADAAQQLHEAMHKLRDAAFVQLLNRGTAGHESEFLGLLRECSTAVSRAFTTTTGAKCRVTIKQVIVKDGVETVYVQDLSRSEGSRPVRTLDSVADNTDFEILLEGGEDYFLSNDLAQLREKNNYKNSHAQPDSPLPYNSTVVWPIRKVLVDALSAAELGAVSDWQDLLGFLCVDCKEVEVFDNADVQMGAALADSLYSVLRPYLLPT